MRFSTDSVRESATAGISLSVDTLGISSMVTMSLSNVAMVVAEETETEADSWFALHCAVPVAHGSGEVMYSTATVNFNDTTSPTMTPEFTPEVDVEELGESEIDPATHSAFPWGDPSPELELYHCLRNNEFILGTCLPIIVLFALITNVLVSAVLLQRHMLTPVNILLLGISMFNMVTGASPIPVMMYFYTFGNYREYVSYSWCFWYPLLIDFVPTVCHTTSIWLTVFVALQRYVYVCRPQRASSWCTARVSAVTVFVTLFVSILYHMPVLFERTCVPIETVSLRHSNTSIVALANIHREWFMQWFSVYMQVKCWLRFFFIHFIPSGSLIFFTVQLIRAIHQANKRRRTLISRERDAQSSRSSDSTSTTLMLLGIVILFLLVEIPPGVAFLLYLPTAVYSEDFAPVIISMDDYMVISLILNIGVLFSYPINFFIYCAMSNQFRVTFYSLFGGPCGYEAPMERNRRHSSMTSKTIHRSRTLDRTELRAVRDGRVPSRRRTESECVSVSVSVAVFAAKQEMTKLPASRGPGDSTFV